jgi:hypothetical protein
MVGFRSGSGGIIGVSTMPANGFRAPLDPRLRRRLLRIDHSGHLSTS